MRASKKRRCLLKGEYPLLPRGRLWFELYLEVGYDGVQEVDVEEVEQALQAQMPLLRPSELGTLPGQLSLPEVQADERWEDVQQPEAAWTDEEWAAWLAEKEGAK